MTQPDEETGRRRIIPISMKTYSDAFPGIKARGCIMTDDHMNEMFNYEASQLTKSILDGEKESMMSPQFKMGQKSKKRGFIVQQVQPSGPT